LPMQVLETPDDIEEEAPDAPDRHWWPGTRTITKVPDLFIERATVAILHEDEKKGHKGAESRPAGELEPRVFVVDNIRVV